jgi:hypothetical protein
VINAPGVAVPGASAFLAVPEVTDEDALAAHYYARFGSVSRDGTYRVDLAPEYRYQISRPALTSDSPPFQCLGTLSSGDEEVLGFEDPGESSQVQLVLPDGTPLAPADRVMAQAFRCCFDYAAFERRLNTSA